MTKPLTVLCADMTSLQHPEILGLAGENLATQEWLRLFSCGEEARRFLREDQMVDEVWIASCEDVSPINLAATLKRDRSDRFVGLLSFQETGSLKSRASASGIDASLTRQAFIERYAWRKRQAGVPPSSWQQPARSQQPVMPQTVGPSSASVVSKAQVAPQNQIVSQVQDLRQRQVTCAPSESKGGLAFLMPVVSGSGGAGKSTVAALLALLAQGRGYRTLLLDFDLQFGDMPALLGIQDPLCIDDVLDAPARLAHVCSEGSLPALLAAPRRLEDAESVVERAPNLLDELRGKFDFIVVNTGAAWAEQHALLLERSSRALFLVDQRPSSMRACRHALDLCARCGIATTPFLYAVNRCFKGAPFTSIDVSCALGGTHVAEIKDGGRDVEELLGAGLPLELLNSKNDLCTSLERLLLDVLPGGGGAARQSLDGCGESRARGFHLPKMGRSRKRKGNAACL